jgi:hypothetical protein
MPWLGTVTGGGGAVLLMSSGTLLGTGVLTFGAAPGVAGDGVGLTTPVLPGGGAGPLVPGAGAWAAAVMAKPGRTTTAMVAAIVQIVRITPSCPLEGATAVPSREWRDHVVT